MTTELRYPNIRVYVKALDGRGREAERVAVAELVREALGEGVSTGHRPDGSPTVDVPGVVISVSHCATCAAIALSDRPIGIDVETERSQLARVAARVLSPAELACYGERLQAAWTLKEALYKAALTPGLDFRRDIQLPLDGGDTALVLTPEPVEFRIAASCALEGYDCFMSLVEGLC